MTVGRILVLLLSAI